MTTSEQAREVIRWCRLLADWLLYGRRQIVRLKPRAASPNLVERLRRRKAS